MNRLYSMDNMDIVNFEKELKILHSIFSANEERVNQLEQRETILKRKLGENLDG